MYTHTHTHTHTHAHTHTHTHTHAHTHTQLSHSHEVEHLHQKHRTTVAKLEQRVSQLHLQLADEQSTVRALRQQQLKVLGDQHKIGDDLSR